MNKNTAQLLSKYTTVAIRDHYTIYSLFEQARKLTDEDFDELIQIPEPYEYSEKTMVIPVSGVVSYNVSNIEKVIFGALDLGEITQWTKEAADSKYENIVYHLNSPGGTITQMYETAEVISELGKVKNTVAFTDTMACSAAQVLAAACNHVYATPSAELGSINVVQVRYDVSKMLESMGVKVNVFTGGDLKTTYWDEIALSDTQRQYLEESAKEKTEEIKAYMRSKIDGIKDEDMRGQPIDGDEMYKKGYITGLVKNLDEFLSLLENN